MLKNTREMFAFVMASIYLGFAFADGVGVDDIDEGIAVVTKASPALKDASKIPAELNGANEEDRRNFINEAADSMSGALSFEEKREIIEKGLTATIAVVEGIYLVGQLKAKSLSDFDVKEFCNV